jgi:glutamate synthase (NADPH/NADH)
MTHRGAVGADARDGDGAGVMTSIPHAFMQREFEFDQNFKLPPPGQYAVGNLFFSADAQVRAESQATFDSIAKVVGLRVLGWRKVPRDSTILGPAALSKEPYILQPVVVLEAAYGSGNSPENTEDFDEKYFERQLYVLRKQSTLKIGLHRWFYICSLSNKNIVYKGQLAPVQVYNYFHDLNNVNYEAHFALVHSRFSTNTFPSWDRAQPMRWAAHNGIVSSGFSNGRRDQHASWKQELDESTRGCDEIISLWR